MTHHIELDGTRNPEEQGSPTGGQKSARPVQSLPLHTYFFPFFETAPRQRCLNDMREQAREIALLDLLIERSFK